MSILLKNLMSAPQMSAPLKARNLNERPRLFRENMVPKLSTFNAEEKDV